MMETFIAALVVFGIALLAMAVGVLLSNRCISGSCGGLAGMRDERGNTLCDACTNPSDECAGVGSQDKDQQTGGELLNENQDERADDTEHSPAVSAANDRH